VSGEREAVATPPWSEEAVRDALGLAPVSGRQAVTFSTISTDSRAIQAGGLFVALKGERFDGHDHLSVAAAAGATGQWCEKALHRLPVSSCTRWMTPCVHSE